MEFPMATPLLRIGATAWRQETTEAAGVIIDAADYYYTLFWAIESARHSVVMSGWQFDSGVPLLRGDDVPAGREVRLLKWLNMLCERTPELTVSILAWDFHLVFAHEREWMQRILFHWMTNSRFRFRFDDCPAKGGSHHQKFVVVDGVLAFLGGMDVCEARWDDRRHLAVNPLRVSHGKPVKPYHDVQAYLAGGTAPRALQDLFQERWKRSGGPPLCLAVDPRSALRLRLRGAHALGSGRVAFSRTDPRADGSSVREVERLFVEAIDAADVLIYVETQYFSSRRIHEALTRRMQADDRSRLEIVILVNERAEALKEELAVGLRQAQILKRLRRVAGETGHALGLYYSQCAGAHATFRATYIHSKLMVVDDRFLTVGSANLTNRSMGLDSELHVSWETSPSTREREEAIRRIRTSLLAEHCGWSEAEARERLGPARGLVARLDAISATPGARLRRHAGPTAAQRVIMRLIDPQRLPFDPDGATDGSSAPVEDTSPQTSGRGRRAGNGGGHVP
jgi:phosphatidylserine/phosphatidylglycerophosphate/cardiolipin synthase-like enzyme